jgi:hypothetical protein
MNTPVWKMEPWREQIFSNGYLAAMKGEPRNPVAMDEWLMGFDLYQSSRSTVSTSIAGS